jgi:hypothetical protein
LALVLAMALVTACGRLAEEDQLVSASDTTRMMMMMMTTMMPVSATGSCAEPEVEATMAQWEDFQRWARLAPSFLPALRLHVGVAAAPLGEV